MDKYGLTKEILALVDKTPMNDVQLQPLIEKYTTGMEISAQQQIRHDICGILLTLKNSGQIDYNNTNFG